MPLPPTRKWTVSWMMTNGEGREVEFDTEAQARAVAAQLADDGWRATVTPPPAQTAT